MAIHIPLVTTKYCVPPPSPGLIPRGRLHEALSTGLRAGRRMTLISAPAGYGKTTLLRGWVHQCERAAAWLSLDADDNDPARFLAYLVAAFSQLEGFTGQGVLPGLGSLQPFNTRATVASLLNALAAVERGFVLILDDYHLIQAAPVHDALTYLLDHLPPQAHIIVASRADPPLPLPRLRARGELIELRQRDLRFTPEEAAALLNQLTGLGLADADVAALASRTEGWAAGLQLAATSIQARGEAHRFIQEFTGNNRYILDYLIEEVLQHQPPNLQAFLLCTSVLERFTGSLCDAVVTGGDGQAAGSGQASLELLERANLFIVPLDEGRVWYRYHRLFADLLRRKLGEARPELVPALHRRASVWHEQHGLLGEAIEHALLAGDSVRAAGLLEQIAEATLMRGEMATFRRWIAALPVEQIRARPALCAYYASLLLAGGSPLELVEIWLDHVAGSAAPLALPVRARVASYRGNLAQAAELSRRALDQLPEHYALLRGVAALNLAWAYHAEGDQRASRRLMRQAALASHGPGQALIAATAECYRADLCYREGKLGQARALYQQAVALATDTSGGPLPAASRALAGLGEIAREQNQLDQGARHVCEAIELAGRWVEAGAFEAYLTLARIRQAQADREGVREALRLLRQVTSGFQATKVLARWVDMAEAWMQIVLGNLDDPRDWAQRYALDGIGSPVALETGGNSNMRRLRKYELPVAARLWLAAGRPAAALALLEPALPQAAQLHRTGLVIEYELLIALARAALGWQEQAMRSLGRALALAEPEGFVRLFVDEGAPMAHLLSEAGLRRLQPAYVARLLAAFPAAAPSAPQQPKLLEPLSERELHVLHLIAEGLSNEAIAERLVLAVPTIKWHTSNIYGKLSVKRRTEAVARARRLGLLPLA